MYLSSYTWVPGTLRFSESSVGNWFRVNCNSFHVEKILKILSEKLALNQ